ncbi:prolipoprotein diacylglyceryl transferase family protein [Mesoplasma lactucae]|uniref:Diacylglyceryl transferase n=1 Tax=Mesoplasma lactucae ATCC 49193 TaxID=81460 RepID=A0A291ISC9_9MOLU|nr:prolipoprotein diacylglyceryl transferase family protein [Mesoplasma lactucae]ATG97638.1 diacylglyceryl transferase [Mesoplasma lactucae ATCC 49193]ATZ19900.1 prolipoprotein diacylglyceryl transferase [Mesoplasma lactucae ATCC 49193]MCL8216763.1 Prolipoprotein diacylglyceryl transferase [Mesoplasma lactucae ATCC 49193]
MIIDWTQGDNYTEPFNGFWTITDNYGANGWFHVYAFTMTIGMILAIGYSAFKFWRKGLPLTQLAWGVIFIVPISLFGASFFGKLNAEGPGINAEGVGFWGLFAFWKGGMAIHGGVYAGVLTGLIVFGIIGHYNKTSLWVYMDAIIPNILLGQAIGRWGNFFNHEVMGAPVAKVGQMIDGVAHMEGKNPLHWLPNYIQVNTQWMYSGKSGVETINGIDMVNGGIYQMSPIFFIESISLLIGWGLITFVIPNIGKWIGKKPWKVEPGKYQFSWKQTFFNFFVPSSFTAKKREKYPERNQSYFVIWNDAFYKNDSDKYRDSFEISLKNNALNVKSLTKKRYLDGRALTKANNPENYWVTKTGAEAGAYFFVWNLVRFFLEMQRPYDHLFIMYEKTLSLVLIGLTGLIGLAIMIVTQNLIPWFFRQPGRLYEKPYFQAPKIDKQWFYWIKKLNAKIRNHNQTEEIEHGEDKVIHDVKKLRKDNDKLADKEVKIEAKKIAKEQKAAEKLKKMQEQQNKEK